MPELPEVETTKQGITPHILKQPIAKVVIQQRQLRWPISDEIGPQLAGRRVMEISRRGKYLLLALSTPHAPNYIMIHLGMSGSLRVLSSKECETAGKHDHVDLHFENGTCLRYTDPRKFGSWLWVEGDPFAHKLLNHLGPEPLTDAFNAEYLQQYCKGRRSTIKQVIMDSKCVVGVGNIYATEALFMAGIHPQRAAGRISLARLSRFVDAVKTILADAIRVGGTTLRDFTQSDGQPGYFAQTLKAYGREGQSCTNCEAVMKGVKISGRSTTFCGHCQR